MGRIGLLLGFLALGCQSLLPLEPPAAALDSAEQLWEQGQAAMKRGEPDAALKLYERSLEADPYFARNHLSLAAAYLEMDDEAAACPHLERYVDAFPDQYLIRLHLAELLVRLDQRGSACIQFEQCIAGAQDKGELGVAQLIHCHAQLMDLALDEDDLYHEHLHRGIGLLILARRRGEMPDLECDLSVEELLCKSAAELTMAHMERPDEARPSWYLFEVWSSLAQKQPAQRFLAAALDTAPFTYMTGAEKRSLRIACQCRTLEQPIK